MTAQIVELESLVEDFSNEKCGTITSWTWFGRVRSRRCQAPAAFLVRTNCPSCGPHRRFACGKHLRMMRLVSPTCAECGVKLTWSKPNGGDSL